MATLAQQYPVFQKAMRIISTISNSDPALVVTTFNHQYITGQIVRLNIPSGYGMIQAHKLYGPITVASPTSFTIAIDTTNFDTFLANQNIGTTNGFGNASGVIAGTSALVGLGQYFMIGSEKFTVVASSGALSTDGQGEGTLDLSTGAYDFSGVPGLTSILWTPISFPENRQYAQVVPMAEINSILTAATVNVLPYPANYP